MSKIVFLPLSPDMWDGFETKWDESVSDPENEVKVIPIPTYKRDIDGNLSDVSYITTGYPSDVEITDINDYLLEKVHPDIIYIQNVQDGNNGGFTVHPAFHTTALRKQAVKLVYIPYTCTAPITSTDRNYLEQLRPIFAAPSLNLVDEIIVQSETQKSIYLMYLAGGNKEKTDYWSQRISYDSYPRNLILKKYTKANVHYPSQWDIIFKSDDNSGKKIVLLLSSVTGILVGNRAYIKALKKTFDSHLDQNKPFVLIWRPYKAIAEALNILRPELVSDYNELISYFCQNKVGILDTTPSPTASIVMADECTGDSCGEMELFKFTGKPITPGCLYAE